MNLQWQTTGLQGNTANQQLLMSNYSLSPNWPLLQVSPVRNLMYLGHHDICQIKGPQVQVCYPSQQNMLSPNNSEVASGLGLVWPPVHHEPKSFVSVIRADNMTVNQTAEWVRTLGRHKYWEEADEYANNFAENNICGYLLPGLTTGILKDDLGIINCAHRWRIMLGIRCLFPLSEVLKHSMEADMGQTDEIESAMLESTEEVGLGEGNTYQVQSNKSQFVGCVSAHSKGKTEKQTKEHKKEVEKWSGSSGRCGIAIQSSSPKVLPLISRSKSESARPSNPKAYKTLRRVKMRSGKSGYSRDIGYLPKGSVVVINQIKGRSGRVVIKQKDGLFKRAGWVTLYTKEKKELLKIYNPK